MNRKIKLIERLDIVILISEEKFYENIK